MEGKYEKRSKLELLVILTKKDLHGRSKWRIQNTIGEGNKTRISKLNCAQNSKSYKFGDQ